MLAGIKITLNKKGRKKHIKKCGVGQLIHIYHENMNYLTLS